MFSKAAHDFNQTPKLTAQGAPFLLQQLLRIVQTADTASPAVPRHALSILSSLLATLFSITEGTLQLLRAAFSTVLYDYCTPLVSSLHQLGWPFAFLPQKFAHMFSCPACVDIVLTRTGIVCCRAPQGRQGTAAADAGRVVRRAVRYFSPASGPSAPPVLGECPADVAKHQ